MSFGRFAKWTLSELVYLWRMQTRGMLIATALLSVAAALPVGQTAPEFSRPSSTGKDIALREFKGKRTVVLAFFPKAFTGG
jgi:peroxiredoxin Q/BCP